MIRLATMMAAMALLVPYDSVIAPPIASSARKEIAPMAVWAMRLDEKRRALFAVKRKA
ncbi:hypothetical protein FQZ97_1079450 [compost metagenome]